MGKSFNDVEKIKIFIVDSDAQARQEIKDGIDWKKEGIELVGEAGDGETAHHRIIKEKPDILITDIEMPYMDGLELIRQTKSALPRMKTLIVSKSEKFAYAQEAVHLGAEEYLIKPVPAQKLLTIIKEISMEIWFDKEEKEQQTLEREEILGDIEERKTRFIRKFARGEIPIEDVIVRARKYGVDVGAGFYTVALFSVCINEYSDRVRDALEIISAQENTESWVIMWRRTNDNWGIMISAENEKQMMERTEKFKVRLIRLMKRWPELEYFGGIGVMVNRLSELRKSFMTADEALGRRFTTVKSQIIYAEELESISRKKTFFYGEYEKLEYFGEAIRAFLKTGGEESISSFSRDYMKEIEERELSDSLVRGYLVSHIYIIVRVFCERFDTFDEKNKRDMEILGAEVKIQNLEELRRWIVQLLKKAMKIRDNVNSREYEAVVETAKHYIEETVGTGEKISLSDVSARIGMSPNYFSAIFHQETGITFVEFLTRIRINRAKELLTCSNLKVSEIGHMLGYRDAEYFNQIFKKREGCTMKEFRAGGGKKEIIRYSKNLTFSEKIPLFSFEKRAGIFFCAKSVKKPCNSIKNYVLYIKKNRYTISCRY